MREPAWLTTRKTKNDHLFSESLGRLEEFRSCDYSYRFEATCGGVASMAILGKLYHSLETSDKYMYEVGRICTYLGGFERKLVGMVTGGLRERQDFLTAMMLEVLFLECYVKGTANVQMLSNHRVRECVKAHQTSEHIVLYDADAFMGGLRRVIEEAAVASQLEIFTMLTRYSYVLSTGLRNELKLFVNIVMNESLEHAALILFRALREEVVAREASGNIAEEVVRVEPQSYLASLLSMSGYIFFEQSRQIYVALAIWRTFRGDETVRLIDALVRTFHH